MTVMKTYYILADFHHSIRCGRLYFPPLYCTVYPQVKSKHVNHYSDIFPLME